MYLHNRRRTLEDFKMKKKKDTKKKRKKRNINPPTMAATPESTKRDGFSSSVVFERLHGETFDIVLMIPMSDFSGTYIMYGLC